MKLHLHMMIRTRQTHHLAGSLSSGMGSLLAAPATLFILGEILTFVLYLMTTEPL
jgi:hypothetical protein